MRTIRVHVPTDHAAEQRVRTLLAACLDVTVVRFAADVVEVDVDHDETIDHLRESELRGVILAAAAAGRPSLEARVDQLAADLAALRHAVDTAHPGTLQKLATQKLATGSG